ncbi:UvrD-helicase domain-containing protein, partial [Candidatus Falkowbacteria bacterium]|nr:UvrD-helicase domain-containing protein [Candidatus Falkowbacteria bacterium]
MEKSQANLNPEQKKAVTHKDGPLLIVAGAGTGKTTVITHKIAWLIEQKLAKSNEILALTFTDKASEEMEERVDKLLPYGYIDLWVSTFHSFCERILKTHGLDIGLSTDFKLLSATDQWLLIRQNLDKFDLDYYRPLGNPTKFIHALINHFSRLKDEEIWPDEYLEYAEKIGLDSGVREDEGGAKSKKKLDISKKEKDEVDEISRIHEVANAYHTYQQLLHDSNYLDFGDLINYTLKLLRTRKNLLSQFQRQFKYILVDEFQDTNWAQYELVKLLSAEHKNITVVGDDDQAIYKFRGASLSNILQFEKDFPTCEKVVLTKNYRSSQKILDLSYKFIQLNNPNRLEVALKNSISKKLESQVKDKPEIKLLHAKTAEDEVKSVINKIIELKNTSLVANEGAQTFGR